MLHTITLILIHQPILVIFGRDVAERVCCQTVICWIVAPLLANVSALPAET